MKARRHGEYDLVRRWIVVAQSSNHGTPPTKQGPAAFSRDLARFCGEHAGNMTFVDRGRVVNPRSGTLFLHQNCFHHRHGTIFLDKKTLFQRTETLFQRPKQVIPRPSTVFPRSGTILLYQNCAHRRQNCSPVHGKLIFRRGSAAHHRTRTPSGDEKKAPVDTNGTPRSVSWRDR